MQDKAAVDNITAGVFVGKENRYKIRIRKAKFAILGLSIIGVVFILIGALVLAYFNQKWNTDQRWVSIIGIVFLLLGFLCLVVVGIMIFIACKIYESINNPGFHPLGPDQYKHLNYPRQSNE